MVQAVTVTWKLAMSASMEVEAVERYEIFESIASKHRPTAVISWNIRSVVSAEWGLAGGVAEQGGIICDAVGVGGAIAFENSSWRECLPGDFPLGIATRRGWVQVCSGVSSWLQEYGAVVRRL
ncbi:hypothetical protein NDU88_004302 [Pleurodeles waltl]|uniref:Uncharacterized protein n=1 Tax=Pleurodeles waltl TaxID=8319 RepID=A0AAV7SIH0_PLEWA|nr:hypothetical protein NDU88_004302 [Pleurodeles waltl]